MQYTLSERACLLLYGFLSLATVAGLAASCATGSGRVVTTHYSDGTIETITTYNAAGERHGLRQTYYPSGQLSCAAVYSRGAHVSYTQYHESGRVREKMTEGSDFASLIEEFPDSD